MSTAQFAEMTPAQARAFMADAPSQPVRHRLAELVAGRAVVDIGCGKGEEVGLYDPARYLGVDCSPELIALARTRWPEHSFIVGDVRLFSDRWAEVGIMKAVLEHLPPDEALEAYEAARSAVDVLYVAWHTEPGSEHLATYEGELGTMVQNRHDRTRFRGVVAREECGAHVVWTVR